MDEIPVLEAPVQPLDQSKIDPVPILNQQQSTQAVLPNASPAPSKYLDQQNEVPPSTGTKRSKKTLEDPSSNLLGDSAVGVVPSSSPAVEAAKRQRRQRILVDMHNQNDGGDDANGDEHVVENAYERERLERIKRNQEVMRQMGLRQLAVETAAVARPVSNPASGGGEGNNQSSKPRRRAGPKSKGAAHIGPRRSSARNRHQAGDYAENALLQGIGGDDALESLDADDYLLDLEEYFKIMNIDASNAIKVDGHYRGWVSKEVAETYGLPLEHPGDDWIRSQGAAVGPSASAAGSGKRGRKRGRGGSSDAKAKSSASLSYNPNAYFYRHVAPHQRQAQGEWTQEEHDKFMEVVREWGVGDSWGLFASHISQRVGYQCSAFYRDVIIPSGAVIDDRFKMQRNGKAVFVR